MTAPQTYRVPGYGRSCIVTISRKNKKYDHAREREAIPNERPEGINALVEPCTICYHIHHEYGMNTVTIEKKEYQTLKAAKVRLEALSNQYAPSRRVGARLADLVGILNDVPTFKGKTSVEIQHLIPKLWGKR